MSKLSKLFKRISFSTPDSTDIIIFDETNSGFIEPVIPDGLTISIFKMRPMEFHITPVILFKYIRNLKNFKFRSGVASSRGRVYKFFWQLLCIYIKTDLSSRNPKAIVTFIDNCKKFAWLSENFNQAPCIAVQNGFRLSYAANIEDNYYCQHLFCFGEREKESYPKMGYKVDNFYPVGSLLLSNSLDNLVVSDKPTYDLLIVSCWRGNIGFQKDVKDTMRSMKIMDELLAKYINSRNINAAVILRSEENSEHWFMPEIGMSEYDYYKNIYGDSAHLIMNDFSELPIYKLIQESHMVVSVLSTALVEAFGFGKKALFYNFCETNEYHKDFDRAIVSTNNNNKIFNTELDGLLNMSDKEYSIKYKDLQHYYISSPKNTSTQSYIRENIKNIVLQYK